MRAIRRNHARYFYKDFWSLAPKYGRFCGREQHTTDVIFVLSYNLKENEQIKKDSLLNLRVALPKEMIRLYLF